jgi:hypothetical protein
MFKKILKGIGLLFLVLLVFSLWMSPRLGGLIPLGKDGVDKQLYALQFEEKSGGNYTLKYQDISNRKDLIELKNEYRLDTLVADCTTDFEKVSKIQSWVQSRWKHDGNNVPEYNNAMYILKEAEKGRRFRCVEYSIVANQCLSALGFKIRGLGLMARDINDVKWGGGHVANEVYLDDVQKWVFIDPQYDVIPVADGVPLNAVELQNHIFENKDFELLNPNGTITKEEYCAWVGPYLYYFTTSIKGEKVEVKDRILGNKKQLTLYPNGAKKPVYFQKIMRINTSHYTHSLEDFYPTLSK